MEQGGEFKRKEERKGREGKEKERKERMGIHEWKEKELYVSMQIMIYCSL